MAPAAESSLYRNGKVLTRRDRDGSDSGFEGIDLESCEMAIIDARTLAADEQPTLAANGFELLDRPTAHPRSRLSRPRGGGADILSGVRGRS